MSEAENYFSGPLELRIVISGGTADAGEVDLESYRISLTGWQSLFELGARLYFFGDRADPTRRGPSPFNLRVRAPERGSVDTEIILQLQNPATWVVGIATGVAGNAVYDVLKKQAPLFAHWIASLCRRHVDVRVRTASVEALAENLRRMVEAPDLPANEIKPFLELPVADAKSMFETAPTAYVNPVEEESTPPTDGPSPWLRQIVESIDLSLEEASRPIDVGCTSVNLLEQRSSGVTETLFAMTSDERNVLLTPLIAGKEDAEWGKARIKFRRLDRESGSVMFRFEDRPKIRDNQFGYIDDRSYRRPHNPYTQAFDGDVALSVWVHAEPTHNGRYRYAIRTAPPHQQLSLLSDLH